MNSHALNGLEWERIEASLREWGYAKTSPLLTSDDCGELVALYADAAQFRSVITMERFRFGVGEYKYFKNPMPKIVAQLRSRVYAKLAPIADRWMESLGTDVRYPSTLTAFLSECARNGQSRPTPLMLRYETGGYNCLHQDLYGAIAFPFQLTCFLSRRGVDYTGGEFLLVEQRPRAQSRGEVIVSEQGEMLIFTNRYRPVRGARGFYRVNVRHGISRVISGVRYALGIIFHDAE